jgi:periplasmic divalent cation tolerance protein
MPPDTETLLVYITTPNVDTSRMIGETLVREQHAACANIVDGVESCYWWQGKLETARESLCLCKTTTAAYPALETRARELHPYDIPCIVALPLTRGHALFLQWVADETKK